MKNPIANFIIAGVISFIITLPSAAEPRGLSVVTKDPATNRVGELQLYNKSYAVIIGIDKYVNLPPDRQLSYAVNDAKGIESVLKSKYRFDKIITLYNEQATKDNIIGLFTEKLPTEMGKDDSLFIFWAKKDSGTHFTGTRGGNLVSAGALKKCVDIPHAM